jgi:N-acetylglutamate synthase-like GNAT family acetyltransferase
MNSSVKIRQAKQADIDGMAQLLSQLFSIEADFVVDEEKQRRGLQMLLDAMGAYVLIAEEQGSVIGMATVQVLVSTAEGGYVGLVEDVVVDSGYRDKGVGAAMLDGLRSWAQDNGLTRLQLAADKDNKSALEFYAGKGWEQTNLVMLRFGG